MNNTLKQLQEKEIDFLSFQIYEEEPTNYYTNVKMLKSYINQQTTLAYNAGKANMLDTVLKEIDNFKDSYEPNLSYQDPLFRDAQTAGENSLTELLDTIKKKLLDNK